MRSDFLESLRLNLTDTLACDAKLLTYFFKGMINTIEETMAHLKNLALLRREVVEDITNLFSKDTFGGFLNRGRNLVVRNEVAER